MLHSVARWGLGAQRSTPGALDSVPGAPWLLTYVPLGPKNNARASDLRDARTAEVVICRNAAQVNSQG